MYRRFWYMCLCVFILFNSIIWQNVCSKFKVHMKKETAVVRIRVKIFFKNKERLIEKFTKYKQGRKMEV